MVSTRLTTFGGTRSAIADHLLDARYATVAHNTRLVDGMIQPFKQPRVVREYSFDVNTIYRVPDLNDTCGGVIGFQECASIVVPALPSCIGFRYLAVFPTNAMPYFYDTTNGAKHPIGVAAPLRPLVMQQLVNPDATIVMRSAAGPDVRIYTYTYVDQFGIESAPAPASRMQRMHDLDDAQLTGFDANPPDNAVAVRIYRVGAKPNEDMEIAQLTVDTTFQLVREVPVAAVRGGYLDTARLIELEFGTLDTESSCLPPEGMEGVIATDSGFYIGFIGNSLYVSERHEVWNWPEHNRLELPDRITGIAENDDMIYVATTGFPARVKLGLKAEELLGEPVLTLQPDVIRAETALPGVSARTMVSTGFGAAYVSRVGIVALQPTGAPIVLTRGRIGDAAWGELAPSLLAWQQGKLYGVSPHKSAGLLIEARPDADGPADPGDVVTVDMQGSAVHAGSDGRVYFAKGRTIYEWDAGDEPLPFIWRSKRFVHRRIIRFVAGKLVGDYGPSLKLTVFKFDKFGAMIRSFVRPVRNGAPFRIDGGARVTDYMFQIEGTTSVRELHIATSNVELAEGDDL